MQLKMNWNAVPLFVVLLLFAGTSWAQSAANEQIRFQGRLLDTGGSPITVTTSVDFNIYAAPTGGTSPWTETHSITPSGTGVFTVLLGSIADFPGSVDFSQPLYIGVTVGTDAEMTPRYLLSASSVAHYAKTAGGVAAGDVSDGNLTLPTGNLTLTSGTYSGDGSGLSSLSASQLTGTVPTAALTGSYSIDISGNASSATSSVSFTGALLGDVTGIQSSTVVSSVGGLTAANVAAGAALANGATDANTALAIVRRDANGGFSAGPGVFATSSGNALTVNGPALITGGVTSNAPITANAPITTSGPLNISSAAPLVFSSGTASASNLLSSATTTQNWQLPDASGTLALLSDITGGGGAGSFTSFAVSGAGTFGSLTVSGTLTANVTGTSSNATQLNGQADTYFLARTNHTGTLPDAALSGTYTSALTLSNTGNTFSGDGANLTSVNAALLGGQAGAFYLARANHTGALPDAALTGTYTNALTLSNGSNAFTGDGAGLANVDATQLGSQTGAYYLARTNHIGALPDAALAGTYTSVLTLNNAGNAFSGDGSNLTSVNAAQLGGVASTEYFRRDGSVAMTGGFDAGGNSLTNLASLVASGTGLVTIHGTATTGDGVRGTTTGNGVAVRGETTSGVGGLFSSTNSIGAMVISNNSTGAGMLGRADS